MQNIRGWLFDVYPSSRGITIWLIDEEGIKHVCFSSFIPSFYLHLNENDIKRAVALASRQATNITFTRATQQELFTNETLNVLKVCVHDPLRFRNVVRYYEQYFPHFVFYTSDILPSQLFLYGTGLFPLAFGEYVINENNELQEWHLNDDRKNFDYSTPSLTMMIVRNANDFVPPKYRRTLQLEISYEGKTYSLEQDSPVEILESLNWHLHRYDPDIILTEYGDSTLMPNITSLANQHHFPLLLNRDTNSEYKVSRESSFFQYGKIVHKDGAFELRGRWHIDIKNSFVITESNLDGLFELTRVTQLCPQHQARASIGTGLSSLQLSWAYRNNILIPSKKREPEDFKSAATLLLADRGGLIYYPPVGYHEQIAELDFVSMYPSIMVNKNVSPETVNCRCCSNNNVPELGYTICEKREGIVPATLRSIVDKRSYYKKKKKEFKGKNELLYTMYECRQNSLKWMLVSCFGYLGYKNARFGRIEAHESVNAFSRDAILAAKEVAESKGFHLVHAIIDCMWLKKEGATEKDYSELCRDIAAAVGIDISLEGIYDWLLFPSSKIDPVMPTGTRYVGKYTNGETKIRGIEARRRDTPILIKKMQNEMLSLMSQVNTVQEIQEIVPGLIDIVKNYIAVLRSGNANVMELVLKRHISKEAGEYMNNSISSVVTNMLEESGIHLAAGESIEFIIIDATGKKQPCKAKPLALYAFEDGYDIEKYTEMVLKAAETLLQPFGYDYEKLFELFESKKKLHRKSKVHGHIDQLMIFSE